MNSLEFSVCMAPVVSDVLLEREESLGQVAQVGSTMQHSITQHGIA